MTKQQKQFLQNYYKATCGSVLSFYKNPSSQKCYAERCIVQEAEKVNGHDYVVTGGNSSTFSCAYLYEKDNNTHLVYHTAYNKYDFVID